MTIKEAVRKYSIYLKEITHIPSKEVEILIMYLLDKNAIWLHINYNNTFTKIQELESLIKKRATNYPLEYLINKASFYGEQFIVEEGVLIPRPETEILLDKAKEILEKETKNTNKTIKILEIGTGSGIISIMLAKLIDNIQIIALDINEKALNLAKKNAKLFEVSEKIDFRLSNLYEKVQEDDIFLSISNPPYIANDYILPKNVAYEPANALFGGLRGDEILRDIIKETYKRKIPYLLCEMGFDQKKYLEEYFKEFNVEFHNFYKDYENFDRGFTLKFRF